VNEGAGGDLVIVAGGLGLAPLRPALLDALAKRERFRRVLLLYGGRDPDQLLYRGELGRWTTEPGLELGLTVDSAGSDWSGDVGVVTTLIDRAEFDPEKTVAMLCGPEVMMRFAVRALRDRGVAAERIHISIERNMKCAITQCGRCVFGPTYACREGPVMRLSNVEPFFQLREV
jgi:NAD(P)H-flavin reductase